MLLKISLGLAILVGLATLYVSHFQVAGKIISLNDELNGTKDQLTQTQQSEAKLRSDNKAIRTQLEETSRSFADATNFLAQTQAKAEEQQARADKASAELNVVTAERNQREAELSQWKLFEMSPEQIRNNLSRLKTVERERDVFTAENATLTRQNGRLERELARYTGGEERDPELPAGTKGSVLAVDPKYDFVVLDIGGNQGLVEKAKLLINRDGKLIGKVKVTTVEPNRAIANVLPEWKQDEVMEGDLVIY